MTSLRDDLAEWWRVERRTPLVFGLKFLGFLVSFTACALILAFIDFESGYDAWNPHSKRIVRAIEVQNEQAGRLSTALPYDFADAAKAGLQGVVGAARTQPLRVMLQRDQQRFNELLYFVDPDFLTLFDVAVVRGDRAGLNQPNNMIISERAAQAYFGADDPLGKTLLLGGVRPITIVGVMRNWRSDSHIKPDFLLPLEGFFAMVQEQGKVPRSAITGWNRCHCYATYLLLSDAESIPAAQGAVHDLLVSQQGAEYATRSPVMLQPLREAYLGSKDINSFLDHAHKGDPVQLAVFGAVALVLLLIAGLSFANFSAAQATWRSREFAVRRILGAQRSEVIARLSFEATLLAIVAAALALLLALALLPMFAEFVNRPLDAGTLLAPATLAKLAGVTLLVGAASGFVPGVLMARAHPALLLEGSLGSQSRRVSGTGLRRLLIGSQFVVSSVLLVFTLAVHSELSHIQLQPRGFDPSGLMILNGEGAYDALGDLTNRIRALPGVRSVAMASGVPTLPAKMMMRSVRQGGLETEAQPVSIILVDFEFLRDLQIPLITGRGFDRDHGGDELELAKYFGPPDPTLPTTVNAVINRSAVSQLGLGSPTAALGQTVRFLGEPSFPFTARIIGVAEDTRYGGPRDPITPLLYLVRTDWRVNLHDARSMVISTQGGSSQTLETQVAQIWNESIPGVVADLTRMEDRLAQQIDSERRQFSLVTLFAGAAVLISVLGVLGFAAFSMRRDARGLAIRRVVGATREDIAITSSVDHTVIIVIATLLAWPVSWWLVVRWLDNFTVRAAISPAWFLVSGVGLAATSFAVLLIFIWRLTASNPSQYLRSE